jgi:hypothetical protein
VYALYIVNSQELLVLNGTLPPNEIQVHSADRVMEIGEEWEKVCSLV